MTNWWKLVRKGHGAKQVQSYLVWIKLLDGRHDMAFHIKGEGEASQHLLNLYNRRCLLWWAAHTVMILLHSYDIIIIIMIISRKILMSLRYIRV